MKNDILPIGSIVKVGNVDFMICAYFKSNAEYNGEKYDYACCLYPSGLGEDIALIKKKNIDKVIFIGFQDGRFVKYKEQLMGVKNE